MFIETANWIRDQLGRLDLPDGARVADVGSSTLEYRTVEQPYVDGEVFAPLRERGIEIVHSDIKKDEGVDVVLDASNPGPDPVAALGGPFDLVISIGMLQVIPDRRPAVEVLRALTLPGGRLLVESPWVFRRVLDPADYFWRPSPEMLADEFTRDGGFSVVTAESVEITGERYYRGWKSRPSWTPVAGRWWAPLPGGTERIRRAVPRWRWRDSLALLRRDQ